MSEPPSKLDRRVEFFALGVVLLTAAVVLLPVVFRAPQRAHRQNCLGNMVSINACGRMWASDHGGWMPLTLKEMSNYLSSPKGLFCLAGPGAQKLREQMSTWDKFDERQCSYQIVNPGISESNPTNVFIRCKAHGHLGYVDGSVFDGKRRMSGYEAKFGMTAPAASTNKL